MTTNEALAIYNIFEFLDRNSITLDNGRRFTFGFATKLIRYFNAEAAAKSVTYPATFWLEGKPYNGTVTIDRKGHKMLHLNHD